MWTIWQNKHISKSISPHKSRFGERLFTQSLNAGIVLDFFEENNIEYYLAYPTLDSEKVLEERCYARGNNNIFTDKLKINLYNWNEIIKDYHPKKLLIIQKNEYLEDVLKNNGIIN